ncbi:hypothetical protein F4860DRAFT_521660 [Xylaria cubensis]|nr:hypothetical protein F4860DRAFT_521660 [Xylaria cubensis]
MASTQFHLLALLALIAPLARSDSVDLLNDIPVNTIMDEGTTFVLMWSWDGDVTGVGQLDMSSFMIGDVNSSMDYILEDKLNLTMGRYPWVVTPPKGRDTLDWYCSLGITYDGGFQGTSGRSFRIKAKPSPSTTTSAVMNSTSTMTMSSASGTGTQMNAPDQQMPGDSRGSGKLPAGTLVGIIVGAIVGVGIFATLIGLVMYYRRKATREKKGLQTPDAGNLDVNAKKDPDVNTQYFKPELEAAGAERVYHELDGARSVQEVDAPSYPTELDSNARSELSGDTRREPR